MVRIVANSIDVSVNAHRSLTDAEIRRLFARRRRATAIARAWPTWCAGAGTP
jgi:hypothetical protein